MVTETPKFKYAIVVRKLTDAFSIGCTVSEACLYAGISRDTYYRWVKNNKTLSDKFKQLLETPILKARQELVKGIDGNPELALKFLERKKKDEFSLRKELTGKDGEPILNKIEVEFKDFSDETISQ